MGPFAKKIMSLTCIGCVALAPIAAHAQTQVGGKGKLFQYGFEFRGWTGITQFDRGTKLPKIWCEASREFDGSTIEFVRDQENWFVVAQLGDNTLPDDTDALDLVIDGRFIETMPISVANGEISATLIETDKSLPALIGGNRAVLSLKEEVEPVAEGEEPVEAETLFELGFSLAGSGGTIKRLGNCHTYWFKERK